MPLQSGSSHQALMQNIKAEIAAGKPTKQAVAIAYSMTKKSSGKSYQSSTVKEAKGMV